MRTLCTCMLILLLISPATAMAEITIDPATATLEELTAARDRIDAEIRAREAASMAEYSSGSYTVGTDMAPGQYAIYPDEDARVSSLSIHSLEKDEWVLSSFEVVRVQLAAEFHEGEQIDLVNAHAVPLSSSRAVDPSSEICNGGYVVGVHLPAGTYVLSPTVDALLSSYSLQTGPVGAQVSILGFSVIHESVEITLEDGNYIQLINCLLTPGS